MAARSKSAVNYWPEWLPKRGWVVLRQNEQTETPEVVDFANTKDEALQTAKRDRHHSPGEQMLVGRVEGIRKVGRRAK